MHTVITHLKQQTLITTREGIDVMHSLTQKYLSVLNRILDIKKNVPESDSETFRGRKNNTDELEKLKTTLEKLEIRINEIERRL